MAAQPISPRTNALLVRLRFAKVLHVDDTLRELLDCDEALGEIVEIVSNKIDQGVYVVSEHLAESIARIKDPTLFDNVRGRLFKNTQILLILYNGGYPDPEIEAKLCEMLYRIASDDGDWLRRAIVEAMEKVGSGAVLPVLDAIQFGLGPSARVGQL